MALDNEKQEELDAEHQEFLEIFERTKHFKKGTNLRKIPPVFKKYNSRKIPLGKSFKKTGKNVEEVIMQRRSRYSLGRKIGNVQLSMMLCHANGFKELADTNYGIVYKSTAPSAGSRHPIEIYLLVRNVDGINDGIYHYDVENHALEVLLEKSLSNLTVSRLFEGTREFAHANVIIVMTAVFERSLWKYGMRSFRLIHLDAGHIGQNVYLIGEAMGLSVCGIGKWDDNIAAGLLKIDTKKEIPVYMMAIGSKNQKI